LERSDRPPVGVEQLTWQESNVISSRFSSTFTVIAATLGVFSASARGDVFLLRSGGEVEGQWTNRDQPRSAGHEIRTTSGIRARVAADHVQVRVPSPKADAEYERIAPTFGPTIAEQWRLADWCRDNNLPHRRQAHLQAILALDPQHVAARRALGYQQFPGGWKTREQYHREDGYELYRGRWRLSQDIEIQEEKAKRDLAQREWLARLRRWRADLAGERAAQAWQRFDEMNDPQAVPALRTLLAKEQERRVKIVYLDALHRIGDAGAVQAMVSTALHDADEEIFYESADRLKKLPPHLIVKPLLDSLGDPVNVRVNRAAYLIGKTGDPRLASPLIDALVTVHRVIDRGTGETTTSFRGDGGIGMKNGSPTYTDVPLQNRYVLEALVELTGQNFDYDQRAWRRWYNLEKRRIFGETAAVDLRRDESSQAP